MVDAPQEQKTYDVAIIGGGPAGLSAAIWLARYLHTVVLIDSGDPRNWETRGINGYLGLPGVRPAELRGAGRDECRRHGVELVDGFVAKATKLNDDCFCLEFDPLDAPKAKEDRPGPGTPRAPGDNERHADTRTLFARRMLLCIGLKDVWPRVQGLEHVYGDRAHVCPDCDGYDARDKKTVVIGKGRKAVGMALSLANWTRDITVCTNGDPPELDEFLAGKLAGLGIPVIGAPIERIHFREGDLRSLVFADGTTQGCERIFFAIGQYPADDLGAQLGCDRDDDGHIIVDAHTHSSVRNVFAAGDIVPGPQLGVVAAAEGAVSALAIHKSLLPEERRLDHPATEAEL